MKKLLSREDFRNKVFERDRNRCVVCLGPAQDAHHIMERRLFDDGGYYLDNGASLCAEHHIKAEQTLISPYDLLNLIGAQRIVLPEHLYDDCVYDKWGNIIIQHGKRLKGELFFDESVQKILASGGVLGSFVDYVKYPRTYHLPISPGVTDDDKKLPDYSNFEGKEVVATLKMDGENTTGYSDGYIHARSIDGNNHASRAWVKNYLPAKLYDLPKGWRICGENLFAKHSIHYKDLNSYFYLFSIWDNRNRCLSWKETLEWASLLELDVVPVLYYGLFNVNSIESLHKDKDVQGNDCEGFVLRNTDEFSYVDFRKNTGKFVRKEHVTTNKHWIKTSIIKNEICQNKIDL